MRRTIVAICFAVGLWLSLADGTAQATEVGYGRKFGLGFELGEPTGLVGKYWLTTTNALDFGVGFWGYSWGWRDCGGGGCGGAQAFSFHADYLWQSNLVKSSAQLDWHIGGGGRAIIWNDPGGGHAAVGARMPVGLDLMFSNPSFVEVFFEIGPALYIGPTLWLQFEGGLGVRFYF
jgi:hypothetical protein